MKKTLFAAVASIALSSGAFAATNASDNASSYTTATWTNGANLGTGFGAWTLSTTTPGSGFAGRYIGNTALGDPAFGLFAGNDGGAISIADRPFTGGALTAGQIFSVKLANTAANFGEVGFQFLDGSTVRWTLKLAGTGAWQLNDGGGDFGAGQAFVANTALDFSFTYNGGNSYTYSFGSGAGTNFTAANITNLTGVRFYNRDQGADQNFAFNDLSVVPEPSTYALLALSAVAMGGYLMRRRPRS